MKRVLHIGKFYPPVPGGMERVVETVCAASGGLVESRVLAVNTSRDTIQETRAGIDVTRIGTIGSAGSVAIAPGFPMALSRAAVDADLLILHEPNPWALLSYAVVHPSTRIAIWYHSDVVRPALQYGLFYAPIARPAYRRAERFIVSSPALGEHSSTLSQYRDRVTVIPFGIDPAGWTSGRIAAEPFVLFAGRHVEYKGVDVLLNALAGTTVRAVIAGDGPKRVEWEALAERLGLRQQVRFTGDMSEADLRTLMETCAALVLPSITRAEAFGYVQLEAMACGKPVVSTDVPSGVSWVNQHDVTGLIVPTNDSGALREALERLMRDTALRQRLGGAGRRRVEQEFTLAHLRNRLASLYSELHLLESASPRANAVSVSGSPRREAPRLNMKRAFDATLAAGGLVLSSPLWMVFAAAIKLEDGGPVFYRQSRVGLDGRTFDALKFRSMRPDAESATGAIQAPEHDPRVTRIGRFMRATAMDELPQLVNILRGDMSFVGPRALRPGEIETGSDGRLERLEDVPGFEHRIKVRPGLTGLAQVYARRDVPRRQKFKYDRLYVDRRSWWLDVRLILLSFWISLLGTWEVRGRKY